MNKQVFIGQYDNFYHDKYGYCYYSIIPNKKPLIYNLYTEPEFRQKGHARKMLQFVIDEIRKTGYQDGIEIECLPREDSIDFEKLNLFYKNMGLEVI
ncbi:MAG: GNAT family N-acetyltransferase [Patescibacteria group bacterium]|jgi:GNAT superfamily N-acetyltransferase